MRHEAAALTGPRRSDASANIARIVAAARAEFARDGASTTLSQIATVAGVADATLYRHFPNRQALAAAVYASVFDAEVKPAILALADAPPEAFIDVLALLEDVMFAQRPLIATLDDLASVTTELILRDRELLEEFVARSQERGNLRTDFTAEEVATFVAMITTASVAMDQPKPLRRRYLALMVDALSPAAAAGTDNADR
ncbi:helix-turn-helix domain containing protein [Mycobacterium sp. CVI_P3]|uniref:Helix-turn-helix domain containing protein n=1 Tax=Mycobacterium pinniadriaticum TaxID=2994102 RepID=A0ABT3SP91_9MYCO|nr:TetR/AcrR family transcriptional regulator [Mycobacterium pinniadriaticum]MCX2934570.1 helix-turn-helix domain containing protein [Mycobacterium pinniadriaticum]MCX2940993.1 helix-turn-helix domain containing protein [Mycobacterium pinniadriaticum]